MLNKDLHKSENCESVSDVASSCLFCDTRVCLTEVFMQKLHSYDELIMITPKVIWS